VYEADRPRQQTATAAPAPAIVRRTSTHPASEITIDQREIDPHLVAFHGNRKGNEQCNKLAVSLVAAAGKRHFKRVLVASANHGEGRTSVVLNLACALARARRRVLVVDCDLTNPSLLKMLGAGSSVGLEEAVSRGMGIGAAIARVKPYGFNLLPLLRPVENPAGLMTAPEFWKTLASLDADYDFVLFDSPPLLAATDSNMLARFADTTLLVVRPGATSSSQMGRAIEPFAQDDLFGVVINRVQE
jgi:Mrp family chromosome partitioning ATPase